ncbi:MAG: DEAD/DEAH box helicase family protein [Bacteroidaceae bacterium]|nr:DEAD/DEAH box helicase family protein [Bacteroidaceae bacterium]
MIVELFSFQQSALERLRRQCAAALSEYRHDGTPQVVAFTAPTGSGKTIILSALIESILTGSADFVEQPEAIFVWLSDSPELNEQSRDKIAAKADKIRLHQCVAIRDVGFDRETLEEGHIYFLNTQKLSRTSNLTRHSDARQYTIWETLANTIREKSDRLYFIIDEAHRGMRGREAGRATTIMQKFILGSEADSLPPAPVVVGMSATIERFSQLVKKSASTQRSVKVLTEEVRQSGLLKDRVVITYPAEQGEQKDMAVLAAATDEWVAKCRHWEAYCKEQHHWMVRPVFVVQVLNGSGGKVTDTDLAACLEMIERRAGLHFESGEVVHAFGDTRGALSVGGREVLYCEPSKIQDTERVRLVFFKETLSTGWDCPRAETMMSFRRYTDATAIAQLLGRMVRTPIQKHIQVDDTLNEVRLFLPHFDAETVSAVVDELQHSEGGELPTDIYEDDLQHGTLTILTSRPRPSHQQAAVVQEGPGLWDAPQVTNDTASVYGAGPSTEVASIPRHPKQSAATPQPAFDFEYDGIAREAIVEFINRLALPTYHIRGFVMNNPIKSLAQLTSFLLTSGLDVEADTAVIDEMTEMIHQHIAAMKRSGKYAAAREQVLNFEMFSQVYDAFGEPLKRESVKDLFLETSIDLERQVRIAERRLGEQGVAQAYGRKYDDTNHPGNFMVDVVIYASDEGCQDALASFAKRKYRELNDKYRSRTIYLSDTLRTRYRDIVRDSAEVSNVPFTLGENIAFRCDENGAECSDHLFIDERTGYARIRLNKWEQGVIDEERRRADFRCWYRNPSRGSGALCLPYRYKGQMRGFYPDFLVVRREAGGGYLLDILEPHDATRDDNVGKAQALAQYAGENPSVMRAQLIREQSTPTGKAYRRLDFAASTELRERVQTALTNEDLDKLFEMYAI